MKACDQVLRFRLAEAILFRILFQSAVKLTVPHAGAQAVEQDHPFMIRNISVFILAGKGGKRAVHGRIPFAVQLRPNGKESAVRRFRLRNEIVSALAVRRIRF